MQNIYPFHYEVRFKFFGVDDQNNIWIESTSRQFKDRSPLLNREDAFSEFQEYLSFLAKTDKLTRNKLGNLEITQPANISEKYLWNDSFEKGKLSEEDLEEMKSWEKKFEQFKEYLSIYLIITDESIAKDVLKAHLKDGQVETEFEIHRVGSWDFDGQEIVDNLNDELLLYNYYDIDVSAIVETVYHFGDDYYETGEDVEDGAKRTILRTPHKWTTLEQYEAIESEHYGNEAEDDEREPDPIDYLSLIGRGEGNQIEFKSSLLYNFNTGKAGISVKYIIAKAICGFLNSNGGVLFVGIKNDGKIQGLEYDYSLFPEENARDKILLELDSLIYHFFGISIKPLITPSIAVIEGKEVLVIVVQRSNRPIVLMNHRQGEICEEFHVRMSASTHQLKTLKKIFNYIFNQWNISK